MAEGFKIASAYVTVDPDTQGFRERLQSELDAAVAGVEAKAKVGLDQGQLDADLADAKGKVREFASASAKAKLGADDDELRAKADDAEAKLDKIKGTKATAKLDADAELAKATIKDLEAELAILRLRKQGFTIEANASPAEITIARLEAQLLALKAERADPKVGLDSSGFMSGIGRVIGMLTGVGLITAHPVVSAIAGGLSALTPGIGAAGAGLGLLAGTGALAFGGVARALQAHSQASQNIGISGAQLAATAFSNAVAVQQAQQQVQQAFQQSAQDAIASAAQIRSSQTALADTERNAAASEIAALQAVGQSEQSLKDAQFGAQQAQVNLTNARIQARLTLQQLNDAEKDSVLSAESARLALEQAQRQQILTDQNAMSTQLDKEQAALAVAQAQRQVTESEQNQKNSRDAANRANKAGVDGSQQVVQAEHAMADAMYAVRNALQQVSNSERNLRNTRLNNADAVKQAQQSLRMAQEQAAYQAKRDAQAIASAEQNVTNTIREQQLAYAATMATGNQAANQFARDMARLTPAGRALVSELLSMRGAVRGLESVAQNTIAPGLTIFLRGLRGIMPEIRAGVAGMGHAISSAFGQFGHLMGTSAFREGLAGLLANGVRFANIVLPAFARFLQMLGQAGGKTGAASGLANLLAGLANGLSGLVSAVTPAIPAIDRIFSVIGKALAAAGPLIGQVVAGVAQGLAPAISALLPGWRALTGTLGPALALALRSLGPALLPIGRAVSDIVIALAPLLPLAARWIAQMVTGLTPSLIALLPLFSDLSQLLPPILQGLTPLIRPAAELTLVLLGIAPVTAKVIGWLIRFVDGIVRVTAAVIRGVEDWKTSWHNFSVFAVSLWTGLTSWVSSHVDGFLSAVKSAFHAGVHDLGSIWHTLEGIFRTPVDFMINTVYDHGIRHLWNEVIGAVGLGSTLSLPFIPQMARGGVHPGRDTGRDQYLVKVRGGEGFLAPETVQGTGPGFVSALNAMFTRGGGARATAAGVVPGFAKGGLLGWIDRGISDIGKIILGGVGAVTGLVTHPAATIEHLLDRVVGTPARGDLGQVLTAMPRTLIGDLGRAFAQDSPAGGMSIGTRGGLTGGPLGNAIVKYTESFVGRVPYLWGGVTPAGWDCSGMVWDEYRHFGFDPPRTSEAQWQWVQRTPRPVLGGLAFFAGSPIDPPPGHVGIVTGADQIVNAYGTGFGTRYNAIYGSAGQVIGFGVPPGSGMGTKGGGKVGSSFDAGGWLMPGPANQTGQPEAVLTPAESQAFVALVRSILNGQSGGSAGRQVTVNQNYFGPQMPTPEMQAQQRRELALILG